MVESFLKKVIFIWYQVEDELLFQILLLRPRRVSIKIFEHLAIILGYFDNIQS